jgi:glycosyltransferase involved in cell wall biosynthesis
VAHFSENLLPSLAERCDDIKLFSDAHPPADSALLENFPWAPISTLEAEASSFDAILYHMGNNYAFHRTIFEALWRSPGIVMLHDCVLNQFFTRYALGKGNFGAFRRLFELCYGDAGREDADLFIGGRGDPYAFPMAGAVAGRSRGTIVMSAYGEGIIRRESPSSKVLRTEFPYFPPTAGAAYSNNFLDQLGIGSSHFIAVAFGHMTPAKRIDVVIEAFSRFSEIYSGGILLLAGQESGGVRVNRLIAKRPGENMHYLGYLEDAELNGLMDRADVFINLRYPSNGEMSSALMHALGRGKAVIVSNYAQFAEFPDSVCAKVDLGPGEIESLAREIEGLARDEERRRAMGEAAKQHVEQHHTRAQAADAIIQFATKHAGTEPALSDERCADLLAPDNFFRRERQKIVYNSRDFLARSREMGTATAMTQVLNKTMGRLFGPMFRQR